MNSNTDKEGPSSPKTEMHKPKMLVKEHSKQESHDSKGGIHRSRKSRDSNDDNIKPMSWKIDESNKKVVDIAINQKEDSRWAQLLALLANQEVPSVLAHAETFVRKRHEKLEMQVNSVG